jgi:DNA mismatch repair protein MutS2
MIRKESLRALEFDKILKVIAGFSNSEASREIVLNLHPLEEKSRIDERFGQISEMRRLSQEGTPLRLIRFTDLSGLIERIKPENSILDPVEVLAFLPVLEMISDISAQIRERNDLPLLAVITSCMTGFPEILHIIRKSIDSEGNIPDTASSMLMDLRIQKRRLEVRITKRLEEKIHDSRVSVFLQDSFITQRSGRWVIPVRMDSKGHIPGVVHDVSRSGETAFIEPLEIIGLANELENAVAEEKAEIIRILKNICRMIRHDIGSIGEQYKIIVTLDMLNSISRFADLLSLQIPMINDASLIALLQARHPLLMLMKNEPDQVVPLNLSLGAKNRVMVITGPNAGGKTIAIKTAGLLILMAMSGIPVPADSASEVPFIREMLVDIGDEQSIESSLSTFSAHIANISGIVKRAGEMTVVLMDELGTGTDPVQGGAIACAVLKDLKERGALVLATTHLTDIVGYVHRTDGMVNASMEFDHETFEPLYRLRTGEPGQSHALEIARRFGMPEKIITGAQGMLGSLKMEFHELLEDLKGKQMRYKMELEALRREREDLRAREGMAQARLDEAETLKKDILRSAYAEAGEIILNIKREVYAILDEAKKEKRREVKKKLLEKEVQIAKKLEEYGREPSVSLEKLRQGDTVFVRSIGYDAEVVRIDTERNLVRVKVGNKDIEVPAADVGYSEGKRQESKLPGYLVETAEEPALLQCNFVGLRVDEALSRLEPFLNHASLAGLNEVTIIHGLGTGLLLKAVREHLQDHPLIQSFRRGEVGEGGNGVTVVTLK